MPRYRVTCRYSNRRNKGDDGRGPVKEFPIFEIVHGGFPEVIRYVQYNILDYQDSALGHPRRMYINEVDDTGGKLLPRAYAYSWYQIKQYIKEAKRRRRAESDRLDAEVADNIWQPITLVRLLKGE